MLTDKEIRDLLSRDFLGNVQPWDSPEVEEDLRFYPTGEWTSPKEEHTMVHIKERAPYLVEKVKREEAPRGIDPCRVINMMYTHAKVEVFIHTPSMCEKMLDIQGRRCKARKFREGLCHTHYRPIGALRIQQAMECTKLLLPLYPSITAVRIKLPKRVKKCMDCERPVAQEWHHRCNTCYWRWVGNQPHRRDTSFGRYEEPVKKQYYGSLTCVRCLTDYQIKIEDLESVKLLFKEAKGICKRCAASPF